MNSWVWSVDSYEIDVTVGQNGQIEKVSHGLIT